MSLLGVAEAVTKLGEPEAHAIISEGFRFNGFDKDNALPSYNVGWQILCEFVEDGEAKFHQPMEETIPSGHPGP